jgi:hypothetical protein
MLFLLFILFLRFMTHLSTLILVALGLEELEGVRAVLRLDSSLMYPIFRISVVVHKGDSYSLVDSSIAHYPVCRTSRIIYW